jgi:hypothetical protein
MSGKGRNWARIIRKQAGSGLSGAEYCRQQGLNSRHFYYYLQKEREQSNRGGGFLPAQIVGAQRAEIEIELYGAKVRLSEGAESEVVVRTVRAVREALC